MSAQPCGCDPDYAFGAIKGWVCTFHRAYPISVSYGGGVGQSMFIQSYPGEPPARQQQDIIPTTGKTAAERKASPIARGVLDYFPDAILEVANVSFVGNEQHNPGEAMHWAKEKSTDEADCIVRHLIDRGTRDTDGLRHSAKVAWRALALLQREIDAEKA